MYDSLLLNDRVVPTTNDQGVTDEPISKVITNDLALPVSHCVDTVGLDAEMIQKYVKKISTKEGTDRIEWLSGSGETVEIGCLNRNAQQCGGHCGVSGTDHVQNAYKTECTICGYANGTNGTDMFERRCPECQEGAPGIRYWKIIKQCGRVYSKERRSHLVTSK